MIARQSLALSALLLMAPLALSAIPARSVPSPPAERADRFGVYTWGGDVSAWPGSPDRLTWSAGLVAAVGSRTIRVYMGPADPYQVNPPDNRPGAGYLRQIAASPAYDGLFRDPRFRTYLLTVSTSTGSRRSIAAVRNQIAGLGDYLLTQPAYAGKTFILLNWEGDNAIGAEPPGSPQWDDFTGRTQARADAVRDARSRHPESSAQLYSGLEFNLVERNGVPCGDGQVRCVIDTVAPRVSVDYYSYSAWQTLNGKLEQPAASLAQILKRDLGFALSTIRSRRSGVGEENFILGEWGFARSLFGECQAARYVGELFRALEGPHAFRVSYAVYWQALDNGWRGGHRTPCVGDLQDGSDSGGQVDWLLYGLFRGRNAEMTLPGATFQALLRGESPAPTPLCPSIDAQGIADARGGASRILHPGDPISIPGRGFARTGNEVLVLQADDRQNSGAANLLLDLNGTDGDRRWYESRRQITASLPARQVHDGCALVWIDSGNGVESNAVLVRIQPE
jgi:hypothetical protein